MKVGLFIVIGGLVAALGAGCMTDSAGPASTATRQVEQSVRDTGQLCADWAACYAGCPTCQDDASCVEQALERAQCDVVYDPAPEICPYPG